jgi:hypothetical protein
MTAISHMLETVVSSMSMLPRFGALVAHHCPLVNSIKQVLGSLLPIDYF